MLSVNRREVLRYLGMAGVEPDTALLSRLEAVEQCVLAALRPNAYWQLVPVAVDGAACHIGPLHFQSQHLATALKGCTQAFLFAATLGTEVDALLRRYGQVAPADLVMAQAVATALIETYCDNCEDAMVRDMPGRALRPRFSPGYGDLPLEAQQDLFAALDITKRLGITLTATQLMVPSKSVSAIIGVGTKGEGR